MRIRPAATSVALLALIVGLAAAAVSPAPAAAKSPCWEQVINDWLDNGTIDGHYKAACYQQALKHVPEDLRDYSNITDAINAALQSSLRGTHKGGGGNGPAGGAGSPSGGGNSGTDSPAGNPRHLQAAPSQSYYRRAIDNLGTTKADSLPIPLLVLAGLGTALLLSAAGLAAHKRLRARKPQP